MSNIPALLNLFVSFYEYIHTNMPWVSEMVISSFIEDTNIVEDNVSETAHTIINF